LIGRKQALPPNGDYLDGGGTQGMSLSDDVKNSLKNDSVVETFDVLISTEN
jgi:hypothetical protein